MEAAALRARVAPIGEGMGLVALGVETRSLGLAGLAIISVPQNTTFYADISVRNTTGAAVTKDFLAAFGRYDPATGAFTIHWAYVRTGVSIPTGDSTHTVTCRADRLGVDWDALGAIGTYDAATGIFTIESAVVLEDALTVTGVAVIGMTLRR